LLRGINQNGGCQGGIPLGVNWGLEPLFTGEQALSSLEDKTLRGFPSEMNSS